MPQNNLLRQFTVSICGREAQPPRYVNGKVLLSTNQSELAAVDVLIGAVVNAGLPGSEDAGVAPEEGVACTVLGGDVGTVAVLTSIVGVLRLFGVEEQPPVASTSKATNSQHRKLCVLGTGKGKDGLCIPTSSHSRLCGSHRRRKALHPALLEPHRFVINIRVVADIARIDVRHEWGVGIQHPNLAASGDPVGEEGDQPAVR